MRLVAGRVLVLVELDFEFADTLLEHVQFLLSFVDLHLDHVDVCWHVGALRPDDTKPEDVVAPIGRRGQSLPGRRQVALVADAPPTAAEHALGTL